MKNTKKSLWASGLSLVLCCAILVGTTFAWFTDSVSNKGNKIEAGTLDVALEELGADSNFAPVGEAPIFDYNLWEPGYSDAAVLQVKNNGSLALKYNLQLLANGEAGKLGDVIDVYAITSNTAITEAPTSLEDALNNGYANVGTLNSLIADVDGAAHGSLAAGASAYAGIVLHMQETAGNEYQNLSVGTTFDVLLNATQMTAEMDGFGNDQYDKDAKLDFVFVATEEDLTVAIAEQKPIFLTEDINLAQTITINNNNDNVKKLEINGNGHKIDVDSGYGMLFNRTTDLEVKLTGVNINGNAQGIVIANSSDMTISMDNCNITADSHYALWAANGNSNLDFTIENSTFESWNGFYTYANDSSFVFENCVLNGTNKYGGSSNSFGTIVIDGQTLNAPDNAGKYGQRNSLTFNNCEIGAYMNPSSNPQNILSLNYTACDNEINFNDCDFKYSDTNQAFFYSRHNSSTGNHVYIDGKEVQADIVK